MAEFSAQMDEFASKLEYLMDRTSRKTIRRLVERIVELTPVDMDPTPHKGETKAGWQVKANAPNDEQVRNQAPFKSLEDTMISWKPRKEHLYIFNNERNAPILEYGLYPNPPKKGRGRTINGFSTQAPAGMVGVTVAEFPAIVDKSALEER